jgi:Transposase, Mutator family
MVLSALVRHYIFDDKILSLYARGMNVREIQGHLAELYGADVSPDPISRVTDAVLEEVREWQNRPLDPGLSSGVFRCAAGEIRDPRHQSVVINPVEKLRQIQIDNEPIALGDISLRLRHRLVSRTIRSKAVTMLAECRVPQRLEPLQHRLLDHAIDRRLECRGRASHRSVSGFAPDEPVAAGSAPGEVDSRFPASTF